MVILVRFGELGLKSPYVRKQLLDRLVGNIQDLFAAEGIECLTRSDRGRVYVDANDLAAATGALRRVFGIVSFSPARETSSEPEAVASLAVDVAKARLRGGGSFAIRARRSGTHTYSSQDLATLLGRRIQEAVPGARVDLSSPEVEVRVEVRENKAYVFDKVVDGPGGLPMGSQGRAVALVDSEAGMAAAWLAMKRGCKVTIAAPDGSAAHEPLRRWDTHLKVLSYEPGQDLADLVKASRSEAVFTGTRVDEIPDEKPALSVPVFHPVVGMDAGEVRALAERIRAA
ncbi:MAG TPA: THUMP domain-containing protein [Thermoplasmata archaeon]